MSAKITAVKIKTLLKVQFAEWRLSPVVKKLDLKLFDDDLHGAETTRYHMFITLKFYFIPPVNLLKLCADYLFS